MAEALSRPAPAEANLTGIRLVLGYAVVGAFAAAAIAISIVIGNGKHPATGIAGIYHAAAGCLAGDIAIHQSGEFVDVDGPGAAGGSVRLDGNRLTGDLTCVDGASGAANLVVVGHRLVGTAAGQPAAASFTAELPAPGASAKPAPKRSNEETFGRLMLAIAIVILAARLLGTALRRIGQPQVMGEVLAGILLGPTLLGAVAPDLKNYFFPPDIVPLIAGAAMIGLAFYLFLVGMELDPQLLRARIGQAALISNTSVAFPLALGFLVAIPIYEIL